MGGGGAPADLYMDLFGTRYAAIDVAGRNALMLNFMLRECVPGFLARVPQALAHMGRIHAHAFTRTINSA